MGVENMGFRISSIYFNAPLNMVGNDIVGIRQVSLFLVVFHLLSRCRPSSHQGKNGNYGVSCSSQQGDKLKLWCLGHFCAH